VDYLWSPWRYRYVSSIQPLSSEPDECVFCTKAASLEDRTGPTRPSELSETREGDAESGSVVRASSSKDRTGPTRPPEQSETREADVESGFVVRASSSNDRSNLVVLRGEHNFILLNLYPYTSGHLMIAPYAHVASLEEADEATVEEMMLLAKRASRALRELYKPDGMNLGMNLGTCAGAGVAGHIHMHVLPRWCGDASFMTTIGETRVLPEELSVTWERVREALRT